MVEGTVSVYAGEDSPTTGFLGHPDIAIADISCEGQAHLSLPGKDRVRGAW